MPLSAKNLVASAKNIMKTYELGRNDTGYIVMPLFHIHGLVAGFLAPLLSDGSVVIPDTFSAHTFWKDVVDYRATWFSAGSAIVLVRAPFAVKRH